MKSGSRATLPQPRTVETASRPPEWRTEARSGLSPRPWRELAPRHLDLRLPLSPRPRLWCFGSAAPGRCLTRHVASPPVAEQTADRPCVGPQTWAVGPEPGSRPGLQTPPGPHMPPHGPQDSKNRSGQDPYGEALPSICTPPTVHHPSIPRAGRSPSPPSPRTPRGVTTRCAGGGPLRTRSCRPPAHPRGETPQARPAEAGRPPSERRRAGAPGPAPRHRRFRGFD